MSQGAVFLERLLEHAPDGMWFYLWKLQTKKSQWLHLPEGVRVAQDRLRRAQETDLYVGVSFTAQDKGELHRASNATAVGLYGLYADIDFASPLHKKSNLPPTFEDACLIAAQPLQPTVVVHSGHGAQAWWLFKEAWVFADDKERAVAYAVAQAWQALLARRCKERGWQMDSTFDLARVLRVPGTLNGKDAAWPVGVMTHDENWGVRYNPSDFQQFVQTTAQADGAQTIRPLTPQGVEELVGAITVNPQADVPSRRRESLFQSRRAKQAFQRKKITGDTSPSGNDMDLAIAAAAAGWKPQEITDLLIACRIENGEDIKLDNPGYYRRTVAKAITAATHERATADHVEVLKGLLEDTSTEWAKSYGEGGKENGKPLLPGQTETGARAEAVDTIQKLIRIKIKRIIRYIGTANAKAGNDDTKEHGEPTFQLIMDGGSVMIGVMTNLDTQAIFRRKVSAITKELFIPIKPQQWETVVQSMLRLSEDSDTGSGSVEVGAYATWLNDYILDTSEIEEDKNEAVSERVPFKDEGMIGFYADHFREWIKNQRGQKVGPKEIGPILRRCGCTYHTLPVIVDGKRTTRSIWWLPPQIEPANNGHPRPSKNGQDEFGYSKNSLELGGGGY